MIRTEDYKRELISMLFAQKHVIFWVAYLVFAGSILVAFFWPPTYSAKGSLLMSGKQLQAENPEALGSPEVEPSEINQEDLASEVEIITSPDVIQQAVKYLSVKYPHFSSAEETETIYGIIENLRTNVIPASNVIALEYFDKNPELAVDLLTVLMEQYIIYRQKFYKLSPTPISARFLSDEAERVRQALDNKEDELVELVNNTGVSDPKREITSTIVLKKELEQELNVLRGRFIELKISIEHIQKALEEENVQYFSFLESEPINDLSLKLAELVVEQGNVLRTYHPQSEMAEAIGGQVRETFGLIKEEVRAYKENLRKELQIVTEKIAAMEGTIAGYDMKNVALQEQIVNEDRIAREAELLRFSYETLAKRREEIGINDQLGIDEPTMSVSILGKAFPSDGPVFPRKNAVLPMGLLIGLLTGCALGLAREYFDHSFKRPSDVSSYTDLPVLFSLARPVNRMADIIYTVLAVGLVVGALLFILSQYRPVP
ncbi:GumC family protein [Candidatus Moduliflexota bacterium]